MPDIQCSIPRRRSKVAAVVAVVAAVAAAVGMSVTAAPASARPATPVVRSAAQEAGSGSTRAGCAVRRAPRGARCYLSRERAVAPGAPVAGTPAATTCSVDENAGYTPCNIRSAYGLTRLSATHGKTSTVAIVDPLDDPNAESDLAVYRSTYGLGACTTKNGCFEKVNQDGVQGNYPAPDANFAGEIALDLDMVSAVCPHCHLLLVEASSNGFGDLGTAENEAVALGARVVSNSWGTGEFGGESGLDGYFDHPGVAITVSSGDGAYGGGVQYPTASPYVTSVGGTELTPIATGRGWKETAWVTPGSSPPTQGSGSGCSNQEPKPPWQSDAGCPNRMTADVSAVAADVLSYDTYPSGGWFYSFGTSVSSPIVAGIYGLAGNPSSITIPASVAYSAPATNLHDITKGKTGTCTPAYFCSAGKGYDGPTGLGSPKGIGAFVVPGSPSPSVSGVSFTGSPSNPTVTITGSNLGANPPIGTPESCNSGDTGDDFGSTGLWFEDQTNGWTAGQAGDCIGLVVVSWSSTQAVFQFGNQYANYSAIASGDQVEVEVQGATFTGALP